MPNFSQLFVASLVARCMSASPIAADQWPPHGYSYQKTVLRHHNVHRANHSAPALEWGLNMTKSAKILAEQCVYKHDTSIDGGDYGQNIAAGTPPDQISQIITLMMYNGEMGWFDGQYGKETPDFKNFERYGHFSQIVWKDTTHVGCWTADCSASGVSDGSTGQNLSKHGVAPYFTVCNYFPPGNVEGAWDKNVAHPLGHPTVYAQY